VAAQGGDRSFIENPDKFEIAKYEKHVRSVQKGYISAIDTEGIGLAAMMLGAGRKQAGDKICYSSGIMLHAKKGGYIDENQVIATLYTNDSSTLAAAESKIVSSIEFIQTVPPVTPLIYDKVGY